MKKYIFIIISLTICATILTACDNERSEIKHAAKGYLDGVANYDFDAAEPYATTKTVEETFSFFRQMMTMTDTNYINSNTPATIKIGKVKQYSDSTATVFYHKHTPIKDVNDSVTLVKEDGKWLVETLIEVPPMIRFMLDAKQDSTLRHPEKHLLNE